MKYLFLFLLIFIPVLGYGQTTNSLSEMLWNRAINRCSIEVEDGGMVDDSTNGYLAIPGGGDGMCGCSVIVGAYKNNSDEYIFLQFDEGHCNWSKVISSNKNLVEILPEGFGINDFISQPISYKINHPIFFAKFEIPRVGTDTKVKLQVIPFGLKQKGRSLLCYGYWQEGAWPATNCKNLSSIQRVAWKIQDGKTLDYLFRLAFKMTFL